MGANARIGHLTVCKGLSKLQLGDNASIGRLNWISAYPLTGSKVAHFSDETDRQPELVLGEHAAITNRHLIDCTGRVTVGRFSTIAGFRSQVLTHSINLARSRQTSAAVTIGDYCFLGTGVVVLPGSILPSQSVLGAGAVLNKAWSESGVLYAGVPAKPMKQLDASVGYFARSRGFVL
jgi:acetyltransferase-like isoleucine patch superfamily enzyme